MLINTIKHVRTFKWKRNVQLAPATLHKTHADGSQVN